MTFKPPVPLTVLTGTSPTLRDPVVAAASGPGTAVVEVGLTGPGVLAWTVSDVSGTIDRGEIDTAGDCGSCVLVESVLPLLEVLAYRGHWRHLLLVPPPGMEARSLVTALVALLPDEIVVDTVTCVVDAVLLVEQLSGDELLAERGLELGPADRRNVAELTARQIEYADVCVLANAHRSSRVVALGHLLRHLNPRTTVVRARADGVPEQAVSRIGRFDLAAAEAWATEAGHRPQPSDEDVTTVLWRSTRPLHPERLNAALEHIVDGVVRSRGVVWLANRPTQRLRWESAGHSASLGTLGDWAEGDHLAGCCVLATGLTLDPSRLQAVLDDCLLTDEELAAGNWHDLADPFDGVLG